MAVKQSVLVQLRLQSKSRIKKDVSYEGDRSISSFLQTVYALGECVQTDYLHEVKRPETKGNPIFGPNHQSYNPGDGLPVIFIKFKSLMIEFRRKSEEL